MTETERLKAENAQLRRNEAALKATVADLQRVCREMARPAQAVIDQPVIVTPFLTTH